MQIETTAEITCKALGLSPMGSVWSGDQPLTCALEGRMIYPGDQAAPFDPSANFMSDAQLGVRSPVVSGWVKPLLKLNVMSKVQRAVVTRDAVYPAAKREHRAWFLLNPPNPPFAWVVSDSKMQHLIWRAPLNWRIAQYRVQFGARLLLIRHERLMTEFTRWSKEENVPWRFTDWELRNLNHGVVNYDLPQQQKASLATLTIGESWALSILLDVSQGKQEPQCPDPILIKANLDDDDA